MNDFLNNPTTDEGKALKARFDNSQNELDEMKKDLTASKETVEGLTKTMIKQGEALAESNKREKEKVVKEFGDEYSQFLVDNRKEVANIVAQKHGIIKFEQESYVNSDDAKNIQDGLEARKAVGDISMANGTVVGTPPANNDTSIKPVNLRSDRPFVSVCATINTSSFSYPYTEAVAGEGAVAEVLEGGTKPQIDFDWVNRYQIPYKIAAYEVLSEEVAKDIPRLVSVARTYLRDKHDLFKANQIYFGAGDGVTAIRGASVYGTVFAAGDMALSVPNPNFMDVVNALYTDIYTDHNFTDESSYMPNLCLVNPVDFYLELVSAKDSRGIALYPQASLFNSVTLGNMTIVPWEKIPAGKIFVGDMKKYNLTNWVPYSVSLGWINDQFITNEFTMLGESRGHYFVKNHDIKAFRYDDIATVRTAIATV